MLHHTIHDFTLYSYKVSGKKSIFLNSHCFNKFNNFFPPTLLIVGKILNTKNIKK